MGTVLGSHYDKKISEWDDLDWPKYAIRISFEVGLTQNSVDHETFSISYYIRIHAEFSSTQTSLVHKALKF